MTKLKLITCMLLFAIVTCENTTSAAGTGGSTSTTGGAIGTGGSAGTGGAGTGGATGGDYARRRYVGVPVQGTNYLMIFFLYACAVGASVVLVQWCFTRRNSPFRLPAGVDASSKKCRR